MPNKMSTLNLASFSYVIGYHNYLIFGRRRLEKVWRSLQNPLNTHNSMAVAVMKNKEVVRHSPKSISRTVLFSSKGRQCGNMWSDWL